MKVRNLYILLPIALLAEVSINFPKGLYVDLVLVMVLFAGVFLDLDSAIKFGIAAGLLRGVFSGGALVSDVVGFMALVSISNLISGLFYRENVFLQALLGVIFTALFIFFDGGVMKLITGAEGNALALVPASWSMLLSAAAFTPVIFAVLKKVTVRS